MKLFFVCILCFSFFMVRSQEFQNDTNCKEAIVNSEVFHIVEEPPYFGVCEDFELTKKGTYKCSDFNVNNYLKEKLEASTSLEREVVVVWAVVEKSGCLSNIKIAKDISERYGEIIREIILGMPYWTPGKQNGKVVRVQVSITAQIE